LVLTNLSGAEPFVDTPRHGASDWPA